MSNFFSEHMASDFDEAIAKRHLPNVSLDDLPKSRNESGSMAYINTVKVRLRSLGILGKKNVRDGVVDSKYIAAVSRFQKCVGLSVVDGWVGKKTWEVLEFLCSFENNQNPQEWLVSWCDFCDVNADSIDFANNEAVLRAVYLRLYSMGFFGFKNKKNELNAATDFLPSTNSNFYDALERFVKFCIAIHILPSSYSINQSIKIDIEFLKILFNYDNVISGISQSKNFERLNEKFSDSLEAIARIELWLAGYDTSPGADVIKRKKSFTKLQPKRISQMQRAIQKFWEDNAETQPGNVAEDRISLALFNQFESMLGEEDIDDNAFELEVKGILEDRNQSEQLSVQFSHIASSIFDGVKRAVKHLFRWLKNKIHKTGQVFVNIARYLSSKARDVYGYVRDAVVIVNDGLNFFSSKISIASKQGVVAFWHQKDFDQRALVDAQASYEDVEKQYSLRSIRAKIYSASTRIFRHLMSVFRDVLSFFVSSLIGWFRALLTLKRLAEHFDAIKEDVDFIRQYI